MSNENLKKQLVDLLIKAHVTMGPHSVADYLINNNVTIQKTGRWVVSKTERAWNAAEYPYLHKCSLCGNEVPSQDLTSYCSYCGAKMTEE